MFREKRIDEIIEPKPIESTKPYLKPNRGESSKMEIYFFIEPENTKELQKYYEKLRTIEEITEDKNGLTTIQVQIKGKQSIERIPSMLGCCFRDDNGDYQWYNKTKINNSHWLVKLKKYVDFDEDELIETIKDTKLIFENDIVLIVRYDFLVNK